MLGIEPWVSDSAQAAGVATTLRVPPGETVDGVLAKLEVEPRRLVGPAPAAPDEALRINHTGRRATSDDVEHALAAISKVM